MAYVALLRKTVGVLATPNIAGICYTFMPRYNIYNTMLYISTTTQTMSCKINNKYNNKNTRNKNNKNRNTNYLNNKFWYSKCKNFDPNIYLNKYKSNINQKNIYNQRYKNYDNKNYDDKYYDDKYYDKKSIEFAAKN